MAMPASVLRQLVLRRRPVRSVAAAAMAVLTATALSGCGFHGLYTTTLPGGANVGDHPYHVLVDFANVLDLVPQSSVKVDDVTVGRVESIKLIDWHAQAQIVLRGDVNLPANAYAQIRQTSLLGEKFVSLSYPPASEVTDQTALADAPHSGYAYPHIGLARTGSNPEVEQVLGALSLLLNGGGLDQIKTITHELDQAASGHSGDIRSLLAQLTTLTTSVNAQRDKVLGALDSLDTLSKTLNTQKQILATALDTMPQAVKILADEKDQFVTLLSSLDNLSTVAVKVINGTTDNLLSSLKNLDPVLTQLTKAGSDLPKSMELLTTYPFPKTSVNAVRGDYTNLQITADLNLSDLLNNLLGQAPAGAPQSNSRVQIPGVN
jgi:phospholipid/cholesterol/gamma-HCH transport system substrate-binding protein